MTYKVNDPSWEGRDRLIFSKGHGCYALYAVLADKGILPRHEWKAFYTGKSTLKGCVEKKVNYGLEASCGSLGHGLPIAVGIAFSAKLLNKKYHIFCIMGDGELQEGATWEAIQFSTKHELNNLTVIVDANRLQAMDFIINILDKTAKDSIKKFEGFGLSPIACPGHDVVKLAYYLKKAKPATKKYPKVIIAETIKGFGLKCMEDVPRFHFRIPTEEELSMGRTYEHGK